jgi:hypothetical protein
MGQAAKATRQNRTITVDFQDDSTYFKLIHDGKAFVEFILAFILSIGFQLTHKSTCHGGGLTRHSHYARVRLGGLTIWRIQCNRCKAVFTVLPHFVLRYRKMHPDTARDALLATHGGLSLELCAAICHISPMALYRLVCALGQQSLVAVLTRCALPLPAYILADEKHSKCLTERVYLPTIVSGRVIWHLGYSASKSAVAFTESYGTFHQAALAHEPSYQVQGALIDGFDSTIKSMRTLFPGLAWAIVSVTLLTKSLTNWSASRPRCARGCAPSFTPCYTGVASAKAYESCRWASDYADLRIMSRSRWAKSMVSAFKSGLETKSRAGMRCSKTPRCRR